MKSSVPDLLISDMLRIVDPLGVPGWDDLLLGHPDHSFFHTAAWARVLSESYGYRPCYAARIEQGRLEAALPAMEIDSILTGKRGVALPFSDYCEPLVSPELTGKTLFDCLAAYGRRAGWRCLEVRGMPDAGIPVSASFFGHTLDLTSGEKRLHAVLKDSIRRNIRKAEREGVRVSISRTAEGMHEFYRLNCMTRRIHGLPPQPLRFFRNVHEHVVRPGLGFVALASKEGAVIAGAVYFHFGGRMLYKYGASDRRFQQFRPNDLLMWEAIAWGCRQGLTGFCFGRTEPDNGGLRAFKNGWGAYERTIEYAKYDFRSGKFMAGGGTGSGLAAAVFRRIPIPVSRLIGTVLYRHVG